MSNVNAFARGKQILDNIVGQMEQQARKPLEAAMLPMLQRMYDELSGYNPITGNTNNSLAVGLYRNGELLGYVTVRNMNGVNRPMRMTLKNGDIYEFPTTWSGAPYRAKGKTDWSGDRNYWADEEAVSFLQYMSPHRNGYCYVFVSAVDYARYLEANGKANVLTQWHDELEAAGADVTDMINTL